MDDGSEVAVPHLRKPYLDGDVSNNRIVFRAYRDTLTSKFD